MRSFSRLLPLALLVLLAACTSDVTNVTPENAVSFDASEYLWPATIHSFAMRGSASQTNWHLRDSANQRVIESPNDRLSLSHDADRWTIGPLSPTSLVGLDPGSYFSASDSVRSMTNIPRAAVLAESSGLLYVGADSGVFVREPTASSFRFAGLAGAVTAMAWNGAQSFVYIGMSDGTIWHGTDQAWSQVTHSGLPAGEIQSLAFGPDQVLYCSVANSNGFYKFEYGAWSLVPYMTDTRIAIVQSYFTASPKLQRDIVLATTDGSVGVLNLDGSPNADPIRIAGRISGFTMGDGGALLAATDGGVLSGDVHNNIWKTLQNPIASVTFAIHTWYPTSSSPILYTASASAISSSTLNGGAVTALRSTPPGDMIALGHFNGLLYALTTRGCFEYSYNWTEVPGLGRQSYLREPGVLMLMHDTQSLTSRWPCGTLVTESDHQAYAFTARILSHVDTLRAGATTFTDVLLIRYANEHADGSPESVRVPYWVLYFGKDRGLVMSEKVRGDSVVNRQVLVSTN